MSKRQKHYPDLPLRIKSYADSRQLDFIRFSQFHMRISDGGFTELDVWTTNRYYVVASDYAGQGGVDIVERGGEKGSLPININDFNKWLDKLFFAVEE